MIRQFEYQVVRLLIDTPKPGVQEQASLVLSTLGEVGWELVTVVPWNSSISLAYLKREVTP